VQIEIVKEEYTNPYERNVAYERLKKEQVEIYEKRKEVYLQLADITPDQIQKNKIEKLLEGIKELNDLAQGNYDKRFDELLALHNNLENRLRAIKENLREKLVDFEAELEEGVTIETILEGIKFSKINSNF